MGPLSRFINNCLFTMFLLCLTIIVLYFTKFDNNLLYLSLFDILLTTFDNIWLLYFIFCLNYIYTTYHYTLLYYILFNISLIFLLLCSITFDNMLLIYFIASVFIWLKWSGLLVRKKLLSGKSVIHYLTFSVQTNLCCGVFFLRVVLLTKLTNV